MNMRTQLRRSVLTPVASCAISLAARNAFGLGGDYPNDRAVNEPSWPTGMKDLVNSTNRIGGLFVNANDVFFFSGTDTNFNTFLAEYATVQPVEKHRLILHSGAGEAFSLGGGNRRPCDWKLDGCPAPWRDLRVGVTKTPPNTNYVLEVHFWTDGKIAVDQLVIPKNVEVAGECFKNFEAIKNGMTRAEVEKKLAMDGGLQFVSPMRFIDPGCPGFKINVGFEFQKDAADQNRAISAKDDKVINVSRPYLERQFTD